MKLDNFSRPISDQRPSVYNYASFFLGYHPGGYNFPALANGYGAGNVLFFIIIIIIKKYEPCQRPFDVSMFIKQEFNILMQGMSNSQVHVFLNSIFDSTLNCIRICTTTMTCFGYCTQVMDKDPTWELRMGIHMQVHM